MLKRVIAICAFPITVPAIALQYGLKKSWKSIKNILMGFRDVFYSIKEKGLLKGLSSFYVYKGWRNAWRLFFTTCSAIQGAQLGMSLGAILGSCLPGIGTL